MMDMLFNTYWWARSCKPWLIKKFGTNIFMHFSSISSFFIYIPYSPLHNLKSLQIFSYESKAFISNMSFNHWPFRPNHIVNIGFQGFHVSFHWIHHLVETSPHKSNSSTRWYNKCIIMSKKEDGKCISTKAKLIATSIRSESISKGFHTLLHILLNNFETFITTIQGPRARSPLKANGKNSCIRIWQLCDLNPPKNNS